MTRLFAMTVGVRSILAAFTSPAQAAAAQWQDMTVSATAYNSVAWQTTTKKPAVAAWGTVLKPGMPVIAVSRDLIQRGLSRGTRVKIRGLPGIYTVRDKMGRRWHNKIDIYMGQDVAAARDFGLRKRVQIRWRAPGDS